MVSIAERLHIGFFENRKLRTKLLLFYIAWFVISAVISGLLYQEIYRQILQERITQSSQQTLEVIALNIQSAVNDVNRYSQSILSNKSVQDALNLAGGPSFAVRKEVERFIRGLAQQSSLIESVYLFDNLDNRYDVKFTGNVLTQVHSVEQMAWYPEVLRRQGGYLLSLNAGGMFEEDRNFVSLIRIINDLLTQKPIGLLIINIPEKAFAQASQQMRQKYNIEILISDAQGQAIHSDVSNRLELGKQSNFTISTAIPEWGWNLTSLIPQKELTRDTEVFRGVSFLMILVNSLILLWGAYFISRMITNPIHELIRSMKQIENGEFHRVPANARRDEIGQLQRMYNFMIEEIQRLIQETIREQKEIRKAELNILQSQIKPHFLYNCLDAISGLALSGQSRDAYQLVKRLGGFYRKSLSQGSEFIPIREEIAIVQNYLAIQKIKYKDLFSDDYHIEEDAMNAKIPKLTLQPLVENSIEHGFREKGADCHISVHARCEDNRIQLIVEDDGVGMSAERLSAVLDEDSRSSQVSFGVKKTMERLHLYYDDQDVFSITSTPQGGTTVTISLPMTNKEKP